MRDSHGMAEAAGDVLAFGADLSSEAVQTYLVVWSREYERRRAAGDHQAADFAHANLRLMAALRDRHADLWRAFESSYRKPRGVEPTPAG